MSDLTFTRLRHPDYDLLMRLATYDEDVFGSVGLRACDLAVVAEAGAVFLAHFEGETVGSCQLLRVLEEPSFVYVLGFYIRPSWQGRGFGRRLLQQMIEECRGLGVDGMVLTVSPDNTRAINLYRSAGFVEEDCVPDFYGAGEDRFILRWRSGEVDLPYRVS
ncbi:MAG: GNAT family N-acetyltransferase [Thermoleophilia bacterium]|jgi:ribosomal protein S18 acetylase RimI-like enzyme